jgi:hypothetical protein
VTRTVLRDLRRCGNGGRVPGDMPTGVPGALHTCELRLLWRMADARWIAGRAKCDSAFSGHCWSMMDRHQ